MSQKTLLKIGCAGKNYSGKLNLGTKFQYLKRYHGIKQV